MLSEAVFWQPQHRGLEVTRLGRIAAEARSGKPARQIGEELGAEIHEKTPVLPLDFFQKNCSLLVKQSLRVAGIAWAVSLAALSVAWEIAHVLRLPTKTAGAFVLVAALGNTG